MLKLKNHQKFVCKYIIKKGLRKGTQCNNLIRDSSQSFCSTHRKHNSNPSTVVVFTITSDLNTTAVPIIPASSKPLDSKVDSTSSNLQKLRIKKFQSNQQYYYVKHLDSKKIILKLNDRFFSCRLPKYMYKSNYVN